MDARSAARPCRSVGLHRSRQSARGGPDGMRFSATRPRNDSRHPRVDPARKLSPGVPDRRRNGVDTDTGSYGPPVAACARLGALSEFGKYRTLSLRHGRLACKRSFSRSRREKARHDRPCASSSRKPLSHRAVRSAEFREQPERRFQRQPPPATSRRCWVEHSLACFIFRFLNRPLRQTAQWRLGDMTA